MKISIIEDAKVHDNERFHQLDLQDSYIIFIFVIKVQERETRRRIVFSVNYYMEYVVLHFTLYCLEYIIYTLDILYFFLFFRRYLHPYVHFYVFKFVTNAKLQRMDGCFNSILFIFDKKSADSRFRKSLSACC